MQAMSLNPLGKQAYSKSDTEDRQCRNPNRNDAEAGSGIRRAAISLAVRCEFAADPRESDLISA